MSGARRATDQDPVDPGPEAPTGAVTALTDAAPDLAVPNGARPDEAESDEAGPPTAQREGEIEPEAPGQGRPARYDRRRPSPPTLSVIIPSYNERENVPVLLDRLAQTLADFHYEVIVVDDDSPDRTWEVVEQRATTDPRVRVVRRVGKRGLSSAVLDGMAVAQGSVLAVMDADLQHDESVLPELASSILDDGYELCLGSREAPGGGYGNFGPARRFVSWGGAQLARTVLGVTVTDPMSGYFAVSRERFDTVRSSVNPRGFKIMLELLARGDRPRVAEVGYHFRIRTQGETKLDSGVAVAYLRALADLALDRTAPALFAAYTAVAVLALCLRASATALVGPLLGWGALSAVVAIEATIGLEWLLHHRSTFRHRRPKGGGSSSALRSAFLFQLVALHGVLAVVGLRSVVEPRLTDPDSTGQIALALGLAGVGVAATILVGYALSSRLIWTRPPH